MTDANGACVRDRDRVRSLYAATQEVMAATSRERLADAVVSAVAEVIERPLASVHLERDDRLVPVAANETARVQSDDDLPVYGPGHPAWQVYEQEQAVTAAETDGYRLLGDALVPIDGHGVLVAGGADRLDAADRELLELLGTNAAIALDRLDRERRFDRLHEATRELMTATDTAGVAATATDMAHEVLGLDVNGVYLRVATDDRLVPVGVTAEARDLFPGGVPELGSDSLAWEVYQTGDPAAYDDVRIADATPETTPVRSELILPLGDHGVFVAGSTTPGAFAEEDLGVARAFAANVEAALDSAERKSRLRRRESELQRQNERLEEFASVVSHDLRNPLNVATGQVELAELAATDDTVTDRLAEASRAHDRMSELIDDLLSLARAGRSIGETEPVDPARLAREEWPDATDATLEVTDDIDAVVADASRLREVFGNLLRNALDHAGENVTVSVGSLADDPGFYVADDGPGIPPEKRDRVFDHGFTTDEEDGTGYGLTIVSDVAEAHGWTVSVSESADGGARFEIVTGDDRP